MTSTIELIQNQEVRRQAMLQAMGMDVWLPRQQLFNAADSRAYLLDWQVEEVVVKPAVGVPEPQARVVSPATAGKAPVVRPRGEYVSVRDKLAALQAAQTTVLPVKSAVEAPPVAEIEPAAAPAKVSAEPIPRFALQLLRADNCLVLVDRKSVV